MARYRDDFDDDRDLYSREQQARRDMPPVHEDSPGGRRRLFENRRRDYSGNRFGERAEYEYDEPRYSEQRERFRTEGPRSAINDPRADPRDDRFRGNVRGYYGPTRSRLRVREVMTRDLVVATRDTTLREIALMMKEEDTGVIPVVDYEIADRNGTASGDLRNHDTRNFSRGKLMGLVTDRDIVVRAVAENKDCTTARAEEVMSTDIHTAKPNDRIVDVIRTMGDKQVRRIPVVNENGHLRGMISMADVAVETESDRELAEAIEEISQGSSFWSKLFG